MLETFCVSQVLLKIVSRLCYVKSVSFTTAYTHVTRGRKKMKLQGCSLTGPCNRGRERKTATFSQACISRQDLHMSCTGALKAFGHSDDDFHGPGNVAVVML